MTSWRDLRARRRYARSFRNILESRQDVRGLATHLQNALPCYLNDVDIPAYATNVIDTHLVTETFESDEFVKLSLSDKVALAAAAADGVHFHVTLANPSKSFTVYVVENNTTNISQRGK